MRIGSTRLLRSCAALGKADPDNGAIDERITLDLARAGRFGEAEKLARELARGAPRTARSGGCSRRCSSRRGTSPEGERSCAPCGRPIRTMRRRPARSPRSSCANAGSTRPSRSSRSCVQRAGDDPKKKQTKEGAQTELGFVAFARRITPAREKILEPLALASGDSRAARAPDPPRRLPRDARIRVRPREIEGRRCARAAQLRMGGGRGGVLDPDGRQEEGRGHPLGARRLRGSRPRPRLGRRLGAPEGLRRRRPGSRRPA